MEPILYRTMGGGQLDFNRQAVIANNLANVNTIGFKADIFQAATQYMTNNEPVSVQEDNATDFSHGELRTTGRDLDIAVNGDGWIAIENGKGKEAYTRAGNFNINKNGMLVTASGKPVLGDGGPISIPPAEHIEIGSDGTISIVPLGAQSKQLAVLDRIKLVKLGPKDLVKAEDGSITKKGGGKAPSDPTIVVVKGALEGSNVNAVEEMINMISAGREYEAQMKLLQQTDQNLQHLAQMMHD